MSFVPMGGFPPIIRINKKKPTTNTLESRGFANTHNIVNISDILKTKKKQDLTLAFGNEEHESELLNRIFHQTPHEYNNINYN